MTELNRATLPEYRSAAAGSKATETPSQILARIADAHRLSVRSLLARDRRREVARARQHAMCELRRHTELTLVEIASCVGVKDHKTVSYGVRAHLIRTGALCQMPPAPASRRRRTRHDRQRRV